MKKLLKNIAMLLIMASLACGAAFSFAACTDTDDTGKNPGGVTDDDKGNEEDDDGKEEQPGGDNEAQEYVFEAEYIDLTGVKGTGISGSPSGTDMISYQKNASNSYAVGSLHRTGISLKFSFTSDAAGKAELTLKLGNEGAPLPVNSANFRIIVNGTEITYDAGSIPQNTNPRGIDFYDYEVGEIDVVSDENVIEFIVGENTLMNGSTQGPIFDAITLNSAATLVFDAHEDNLDDV